MGKREMGVFPVKCKEERNLYAMNFVHDTINFLKQKDTEIGYMVYKELERQQTHIELIASENFVSPAVLAAAGTILTNKYAEGYPGARYYGGCQWVDVIEAITIERAKTLFGAEHANVQPHSGAQANYAVYQALCEVGDTVLGMNLAHGGHLTHGSPVNFSGKNYNIVPYGVDPETHRIDYNQLRELTEKHKPKMIIAGASAYPRFFDYEEMANIAHENGAYLFVDMAHIAGLVAAGLHPNPVPYADVVTTTTHKTLRGPRGGMILCKKEFAKKIDKAIFPGSQGGPLMHIIAAKGVALGEALTPEFKDYQKSIVTNAKTLADELMAQGFDLVSGGTDNHMMLLDLRNLNLTGKEFEKRLDSVRITANKNAIPFDPTSPMITSGLRIGTPAVTSRGFRPEDMKVIAKALWETATNYEADKQHIINAVEDLCNRYPLYPKD